MQIDLHPSMTVRFSNKFILHKKTITSRSWHYRGTFQNERHHPHRIDGKGGSMIFSRDCRESY